MHRVKVTLALAAGAALVLAGCGSDDDNGDGGGGGEREFRLAFNQQEAHPQAQAMLGFSDALSEATDGGYAVSLYADGTLGAQEATIEQVQSGTIDMALVAGPLLESFNTDFSVVNLPYIYDSPEHQMQVLNDEEIVGELYETLEDDGIIVLAAFHGGVRNVYAGQPIESPDDLSGQQIRIIGSDTNVRMMQLMGGVGTPMGQDEVYTAIQSGVIDGGENNELVYSSMSHDEVAPYYSSTQHLMMPDFLIMSASVWDTLDEDTQAEIERLVDEAAQDGLEAFDEAVQEAIADAEEAGATFVDADFDAFREAVLPLHDELVTTDLTQQVYDAIDAARS